MKLLINKLLGNKEFHRLEAIKYALEQQIKRDREEFEKTKIMRCWECLEIMEKELEKISLEQDKIIREMRKKGLI